MWKSKKIILILTLAIAVLLATTAGVAFAQTGDDEENQPEAQQGTLLDRVCEIYEENTGVAIDPEQLKDAFAQARDEMRDQAMESWLQELVDEGTITQGEADQYLEWWQVRPDVELPGPRGGLMEGPMGHGFGGGMMGGRGHHHWGGGPYCAPDANGETGA